jgi:hypothetical protein
MEPANDIGQVVKKYFPGVHEATMNLRIWSVIIIKVGPDELKRHTTLPPFMMHHHFEHVLFILDLCETEDATISDSLLTSLSEFTTVHTQLH